MLQKRTRILLSRVMLIHGLQVGPSIPFLVRTLPLLMIIETRQNCKTSCGNGNPERSRTRYILAHVILDPHASSGCTTYNRIFVRDFLNNVLKHSYRQTRFDYAKQVHLATGPFLQQTAYQNPTDPRNLPYQKAFGPDQTFFESLAADPEKGTRFTSMMEAESQGKASFADDHAYPVLERLQSVRDDGEVLIVDCGAGNGSDMRHFRVKHPNLKGRVIVQDLPYIFEEDTKLEASLKNDGIEVMRHDFFTPQPIAGAQVYFLRQIMQDYSDERCLQILSQIVSVMRSGYSKILITETILPDKGAHWFTTSLDLELMIHLAAFKRTETQMRELLAKAGLAVTGFFKLPESFDSVLEGMLPNPS